MGFLIGFFKVSKMHHVHLQGLHRLQHRFYPVPWESAKEGVSQPTLHAPPTCMQDGVMAVADPAPCRHMSPTCRAFAALTQEFIRGSSKLAPWDKRVVRDWAWTCVLLFFVAAAAASSACMLPTRSSSPSR